MEVDRNGLEILGRPECLILLASATLGRIAFTSGALPMVLPVNFHLDGERILVRTGKGGQLDTALHLDVAFPPVVVAFEIDDFDPMYHSGWSVSVTGRAVEITDPFELAAARQKPIARWTPLRGEAVVAISTEIVSGRRITAYATAALR